MRGVKPIQTIKEGKSFNYNKAVTVNKYCDLVGKVLDVGCRDCIINYVASDYVGFDVKPEPYEDNIKVVTGDLERGLPFNNQEFGTVVALDVLEHVDNPYFAIYEFKRVAREKAIICLPNLYHFKHRIKYLLGKGLGDKYGLPEHKPVDRHKWLFDFDDARNFVLSNSPPFKVVKEFAWGGPWKSAPKHLVKSKPNLFAWWYLCELERC